MQLARQRIQLRLAGLDDPTGQVPHVRVGPLARTAMNEEDPTSTDQRTTHDLRHSPIKPWTPDNGVHTGAIRALLGA
ncbi:hypothetical protein GCM10009845_38310 [Pedococcus bigeumensis]